jgi:hypothetical protein
VEEHLISKSEALSSNHQYFRKGKKNKKRVNFMRNKNPGDPHVREWTAFT